jgi:hypothetical protein
MMKSRKRRTLGMLVSAILLTFFFSLAHAAEFVPKTGNYYVKEIGGVRFHTYATPLPAGAGSSHIIESQNGLVMVDTLQNRGDNEELKRLVESLKKPLRRIYISHAHEHHWVGLEMFPGAPVYTIETTLNQIKEQGAQKLQGLKKQFGEEAIPYKQVVIPQHVVKPGEEKVEGVLFRFIDPAEPFVEDDILFIEFPEQKALIHHHLAYVGLQLPMPPIPARLDVLKQYKAKNYNWVMAGHGIPSPGNEFFDKAAEYLATAQKLIQESPDVKTAKEKLVKAYPTYGGVFLLDLLLPAFYKK